MATQAALTAAIEDARTTPLDAIDVSRLDLWRNDTHWPYFERLRREDPIHYCAKSEFGSYWSITRYNDIMAVDTNHAVFSSDREITIFDEVKDDSDLPMFIAMDPPKHDAQRKVVSPIVAPGNLQRMESLIRERAGKILDALPVGETFDWVDKVSIELTTQMLATLFDFPFEDRRKLTYWSDVVTTVPGPGRLVETAEEQLAITMECLDYFIKLWNQRVNAEPAMDLVSMLAHAEATRNMGPMEYLGNVILLIVGGNDTTRNTITASVLALNQNPEQYRKLREYPELIPSMVSETIRWQTPLAHMRRTATRDFELNGKHIRKGDKVVMWYVSGNRDDEVIERPNEYIIDRENPRRHISFGFGIHRCVGNRLAEMQLRIIWEEILKRFPTIEVVGEPVHVASPFTKGYEKLLVRIPPSNTLPPRKAAFDERKRETHAPLYRQPLSTFISACTVSSVGGLLFNIMPALLGAAAARFSLDDAHVGMVGSSMLAGFALVAATSRQWIGRFDWRALTLARNRALRRQPRALFPDPDLRCAFGHALCHWHGAGSPLHRDYRDRVGEPPTRSCLRHQARKRSASRHRRGAFADPVRDPELGLCRNGPHARGHQRRRRAHRTPRHPFAARAGAAGGALCHDPSVRERAIVAAQLGAMAGVGRHVRLVRRARSALGVPHTDRAQLRRQRPDRGGPADDRPRS